VTGKTAFSGRTTMPTINSVALVARLRISLRLWFATYGAYKRAYHPLVEVGGRLSVAQAFLHSGVIKALDWRAALYLARHEYPVSWMSPEHAAALGLAIELICPVLLALGLFTRLAALPMAILAIVIQTNYQALDTNLLWTAILLSYVMFGARGLSLDALITPGLTDSPLPLVPRLIGATKRFTAQAGPPFQLLLRLWLGLALLRLPAPPAAFPEVSAHALLPAPLSAIGGAMLGLGLGATIVNKLLLATVFGMQMMTSRESAAFWMILLLARFGVIGAGAWSIDSLIYARLVEWRDLATASAAPMIGRAL
jgi:putative oxidoreductase